MRLIPISIIVTISNFEIKTILSFKLYRFGLDLKPLSSRSTTRPWRSYRESYKITLRNYSRYSEIALTDSNFPRLPDLYLVQQMSLYQNSYCECFDALEKKTSDLNTGISVYFQIYHLAAQKNTPNDIRTCLFSILDNRSEKSLFALCFNKFAIMYTYLSNTKSKGNCYFLSNISLIKKN